ncbi:50S ribosomal protein L12 [ANME-1 cluster archaeon GoMg1]|nr:50S ribosomal protein L12 [ANME-1 cluster archaeon GoMg1]VUT25981.1 MAG: 50S ribosomal protein L12 [Candidatus Methanolliviera sp. GoM_asphalt]
MEYIYAALLLHDSGKEITEGGIAAIMKAAGTESDKGRIKALISALSDVNIDEAMAQAQPAYAPAAMAPAAMPAQAAEEAPKAAETKKEEKKKEEEEEKAEETGMEGLASLFG